MFGYQYVIDGLRLAGTLSALTDQSAHFLGIIEGDFDGNSENSTPHDKPLVPALKEMVAYTESLIEGFNPLLTQLLERPQAPRKAVRLGPTLRVEPNLKSRGSLNTQPSSTRSLGET